MRSFLGLLVVVAFLAAIEIFLRLTDWITENLGWLIGPVFLTGLIAAPIFAIAKLKKYIEEK